MCDFCRDTNGNLYEPILHKYDDNTLPIGLDAWIWNKDKKGMLWASLDIGEYTVFEVQVPIRYCPNCGRNLEV